MLLFALERTRNNMHAFLVRFSRHSRLHPEGLFARADSDEGENCSNFHLLPRASEQVTQRLACSPNPHSEVDCSIVASVRIRNGLVSLPNPHGEVDCSICCICAHKKGLVNVEKVHAIAFMLEKNVVGWIPHINPRDILRCEAQNPSFTISPNYSR